LDIKRFFAKFHLRLEAEWDMEMASVKGLSNSSDVPTMEDIMAKKKSKKMKKGS
jgi:hypothetical protein